MATTRRSVLLGAASAMAMAMSAANAMTGSRRVLLGGSDIIPASMAANPPDIFLNFSTNQAQRKSSITSASSLLTVSRASTGYVNDSNGNWTAVGSNLPRLSNNGLLVEEARTNSIRNNSMQGAVVMADGVELLTNPNFTPAGGAGWTQVLGGGGSFDFSVPGQVTVSGTAANNSTYIYQQLNGLVVGRNYVVKVTGPNSCNIFVGTTPGGVDVLNYSNIIGNGASSTVLDRIGFTATATTLYVSVTGGSAATKTWTSFSCQDGERLMNGGFTTNPLAPGQGTLQNGWQWSRLGTSVPTWSAGLVTLTVDATGDVVNLNGGAMSTIVGCTYTLAFDIGGAAPSGRARVGTTISGLNLVDVAIVGGVGQKLQFTATTTTTFISFLSNTANAVMTIANVSVQSAGKWPTSWIPALSSGNNNNFTMYITGVGTESGIEYIDYRCFTGAGGCTNAQNGSAMLLSEGNTQVAAVSGQTWSASVFMYLVGGSFSGLTAGTTATGVVENASSGSGLVAGTTAVGVGAAPLGAASNHYAQIRTLNNASTAYLNQRIFQFSSLINASWDFTLRIGWPQLELGASVTSPIRTTSAAATRAADVVTLTAPPTFGSAYSLFAQGTPQAPIGYGVNQNIIQFDTGGDTQRTVIRRGTSGGTLFATVGGTGVNTSVATVINPGVTAKYAFALAAGDQQAALNSVLATATTAASLPTTPTKVDFGVNGSGTEQFNGFISQAAIWAIQRVPNAQLQGMTK